MMQGGTAMFLAQSDALIELSSPKKKLRSGTNINRIGVVSCDALGGRIYINIIIMLTLLISAADVSFFMSQ